MAQLTPQENFRFGFLLRCAEEGCSPADIEQRVKLAFVLRGLEKLANMGQTLSALSGLASTYGMAPLHTAAIGIGSAGLLGAGLG